MPLIAASLALVIAASAAIAQDASTPVAAASPAEPAPSAEAAPAPTEAPVAVLGDASRGKSLTFTCRGCHGITGYKNAYPSYHVPKLGGQSKVYLNNALNAYRQGQRKHPTMQAQAESFSEQDIADIAAYLSSIK